MRRSRVSGSDIGAGAAGAEQGRRLGALCSLRSSSPHKRSLAQWPASPAGKSDLGFRFHNKLDPVSFPDNDGLLAVLAEHAVYH